MHLESLCFWSRPPLDMCNHVCVGLSNQPGRHSWEQIGANPHEHPVTVWARICSAPVPNKNPVERSPKTAQHKIRREMSWDELLIIALGRPFFSVELSVWSMRNYYPLLEQWKTIVYIYIFIYERHFQTHLVVCSIMFFWVLQHWNNKHPRKKDPAKRTNIWKTKHSYRHILHFLFVL